MASRFTYGPAERSCSRHVYLFASQLRAPTGIYGQLEAFIKLWCLGPFAKFRKATLIFIMCVCAWVRACVRARPFRLDTRLRYFFALPRTSTSNYGLLDVTGNVHRRRAAFLSGYPLLPYLLHTKTAQRHAVLLWCTYSGAPPSCNSCSVSTVMRIPIVARHNKIRQCCHLAVTVSRT